MTEEGYPDRIISSNEIEKLESLLRSQDLEYPNYKKWVSNTIQEVESGDKIAFGFFTSAKDIVGDGIIRITASKTVELKNFFLRKDFRSRGIGSMLLDSIENYCIERGCTQIHVDMSIDEKETLKFFIKKDYEFQNRGDFYGQGKESYLLVKKLPIKYIGHYDWIAISQWVMARIFGYTLVDEKYSYYDKKINDVKFMATMLVCDDLDHELDIDDLKVSLKEVLVKGNLIYFAPYFSEAAINYSGKNGITLIDRIKLEELTGLTLPTSSKDTAGLIVVVKPEYFEHLVQKKDRVFIKGGRVFSGVEKNQVLLFYVTSPIQAISGYTEIMKITTGHPSEIWKKYSRQSAFTVKEYMTYTEGKSIVTAYSFEKIKKLKNPIRLEKIRKALSSFNHQAGQKISTDDLGIIRGLF
jgi:predicted transcriptional regulator/GNAT superfamily N-acetyltransferase